MSPQLMLFRWSVGVRPKSERLWSLRQAGKVVYAEATERRIGHEVRLYLDGRCFLRVLQPTRELAATEADEIKRVGLTMGWRDHASVAGV
jgi:hypothetical protein